MTPASVCRKCIRSSRRGRDRIPTARAIQNVKRPKAVPTRVRVCCVCCPPSRRARVPRTEPCTAPPSARERQKSR
eukprot:4438197-Prymnesium_polylepis.2